MERADVVVVGAGILGLASARALLLRYPELEVAVLEKEPRLAAHQSGHNSGVIHSGIYYPPDSTKATMVARGRRMLEDYCDEFEIPYDLCGKVVVATTMPEVGRLHDLQLRAEANDIEVHLLDPDRLAEHEPHVRGLAALHVPSTGIVDFTRVCAALATEIEERGGRVHLSRGVTGVTETETSLRIDTNAGEIEADQLVNCGGLQSDRLAALAGADTDGIRILPFRGEYRELVPESRHLVRNLVYPVPDPGLPFLGVHLTRMIDGAVHVGPNAVLALEREGYEWTDVDPDDAAEIARAPGTWKLFRRYWRTGVLEIARSLSERVFLAELRRLLPDATAQDLTSSTNGVRAQAVDRDGNLVDDFAFAETARVVNVVNAPSPAATASLEIGRHIADRLAHHRG